MSFCVTTRNNGNLRIAQEFNGTDTQTNCDFVVFDKLEALNSFDLSAQLTPLFNTYFAFDPDLFGLIVGISLATFVGGVTLGHVVSILKKT